MKSYTCGILLICCPITSNTPLDIQDFQSVMDMNLYSRIKEIFWIENMHFKHKIKIRFCANFVCINKSSWNNHQDKITFQMVRVLVKWIWELTEHNYQNSIPSVSSYLNVRRLCRSWTITQKSETAWMSTNQQINISQQTTSWTLLSASSEEPNGWTLTS